MGSWIPCYNRRESDLYNCWLVNAKLSQAIHCGILIRHIVQCTINNHWQVASSVLWHLLPATSFTTCARHAPLNTISSLGSIMINMVLLCACFCLPWHKYLTILLCHMCQHFCHKRLSCAQYPTSHKKKKTGGTKLRSWGWTEQLMTALKTTGLVSHCCVHMVSVLCWLTHPRWNHPSLNTSDPSEQEVWRWLEFLEEKIFVVWLFDQQRSS